jgi:excisionase family DNA binding protein
LEKAMNAKTEELFHLSPAAPLKPKDRELAGAAERCIMAALDHCRAAYITVAPEDGGEPSVMLPPDALRVVGQLLGLMSQGHVVALVPEDKEFTTVEAAAFLNVSRPFVIKEIEANRLPHRMVGTHRRIAFADLRDYAVRMRARQASALERMAENARELGLEY